MSQSLYAYVMTQFDSTSLTYQEVADGSGVPKRTIEKIARREIEDPGVSQVQKIADFFRSRTERAAA